MKILCKVGLHWPMAGHVFFFTDRVEGIPIYDCHCPCGRTWMVANKQRYPRYKVETKFYNKENEDATII
jgi:hypothetical protein